MANVSIYYNNALIGSEMTATEMETLSSVHFAADNRISYKTTATGAHTNIEIEQPGNAIQEFRYLVLVDHTMAGGEAVVRTYPTDSRVSETVAFSGTLSSDDPNVTDFGSVPSDVRYVDIELTASGSNKASAGEIMLASKFTSPQYPGEGIPTTYTPRRTFIGFPNGEVASIRHGGTVRQKTYTIPGLTLSEAEQWIDVFRGNEGAELVVLSDDEGETYPAYMNQELGVNNTANRIDLALVFREVKL